MAEVEGRGPVDRHVLEDSARGAGGIAQILIGRLLTETWVLSAWQASIEAGEMVSHTRRSVNGMDMLRKRARVNQRIEASQANAAAAFHAPEGMGAAERRENGKRDAGPHGDALMGK
jgi:hypothetical protein